MNKFGLNTQNSGKPFKFEYSTSQPYGPNLLEIIERQYDYTNSTSSKEGILGNDLRPDISDIEIKLSSNSDLLSIFRRKNNNSLNFDEALSPINRDLDFTSQNFIANDDDSMQYMNDEEFNILDPLENKESYNKESSTGSKFDHNTHNTHNIQNIQDFNFNPLPDKSLKGKREKSMKSTIENDGAFLTVPKAQKGANSNSASIITRNTNLIQLVKKKQENLQKDFSPIHEESSNFNFTFDKNAQTQNQNQMSKQPKVSNYSEIKEMNKSQDSPVKSPTHKDVVETKEINKSFNDQGKKMINQYVFEAVLGKGGFGKVVLASDQNTSKFFVFPLRINERH